MKTGRVKEDIREENPNAKEGKEIQVRLGSLETKRPEISAVTEQLGQ